jgi:hypothetical protein
MKIFIRTACVLLAVTAGAKLISALGEGRILAAADPLFGFLSNRQVLFLAAAVELGVVAFIWNHRSEFFRIGLLAWISTLFLAYRAGLWAIGYQGACKCLGHLSEAIGLTPASTDLLMKGVLFYLLAGSYFYFSKFLWEMSGAQSKNKPHLTDGIQGHGKTSAIVPK